MDLQRSCVCGAMISTKLEPEVGIQLCYVMSRTNSYRGLRLLTPCSLINIFGFGGCVQRTIPCSLVH
jgi:hypothetical protein